MTFLDVLQSHTRHLEVVCVVCERAARNGTTCHLDECPQEKAREASFKLPHRSSNPDHRKVS